MKKKSIILIICVLVIIFIAVILLLVTLSKNNIGKNNNSNIQIVEPKVELKSETKNEKTIIYVTASIEGDNNISTIVLPNGEIVENSTAEYEVNKSGEYEFVVTASNGTSVTKSITIEDLDEASANNPYIPDGFTEVSKTTVETGYIIEDENGNQFVWVPVKSGILNRNTDKNTQYEETDNTATGLYNSVAKYYGFYIARYEASKTTFNDTETVASKKGVLPWSNITYTDCYEISNKMASIYGYSGVKTALINSYAWDTTLDWINKTETNYSSNTSYGNYSGTILKTGETENDEVNSICDMAGNLREWTTEIYYPETVLNDTNEVQNNTTLNDDENIVNNNVSNVYRVIRGGSANINKVANSHIGQLENMSDSYWGFRVIMYKD